MKFVASIRYADEKDSYDLYYFNQDFPFVADSIEEAKMLVNSAVEANTKAYEADDSIYQDSSYDNPVKIPTVFGMNFGEIEEGQTLKVDVMTLDEWFDKNKRTVDCQTE